MIKLASGVVAALVALGLGGCGSSSNGGGGGGGGDDCVRSCEKAKALHCPNDDNATADCPTDCRAQALLPFCKTEWAALMACSANAPASCDADGKPSADGCSSQGLAYLGCLFGNLDAGLGGD